MDAEELKRVHGDDVELQPDDSEDEHLTEADALARAKEEGIEFVDTFHPVHLPTMSRPNSTNYATREDAEKARLELESPGEYIVAQSRARKS
jgi:hypothetical protein